jgi:predicted SAM-dependent methyltransferase
MRHQSPTFVKIFLEKYSPKQDNVLEVGSLDVNGNIRNLFSGAYVGLDMRDGNNVDVVCNGHDLVKQFGKEQFDLVICIDTLEHDDAFWVTVEQMKKVLRKGGWLILGVPSRRCPLHEHPSDYWRFMSHGMEVMLDGLVDTYVEVQRDAGESEAEDEIYGYGRKNDN